MSLLEYDLGQLNTGRREKHERKGEIRDRENMKDNNLHVLNYLSYFFFVSQQDKHQPS